MKLFQAQVHRPFSDDQLIVTDAMMIIATAMTTCPEGQSMANAFWLYMSEDTIIVETVRSDGREVFARLHFDGQRFILASEGFI